MKLAIIGAGITGRFLAWHLQSIGHQVHVFEKQAKSDESSSSFVAAGMLAPFSEIDVADEFVIGKGADGIFHWKKIIQKYFSNVYFRQSGSLIVSHFRDRATFAYLQRKLVDSPFADKVEFVGENAIRELEPELGGRFSEGLFLETEACLDAQEMLRALQRESEGIGVRYCFGCRIEKLDDLFIHDFDHIFDTRGIGAKSDLSELRGVRGELLRVHAPNICLNRPIRLVHPRYPVYIVPQPKNIFVVGATMLESESLSQISVLSSAELLSAAMSVHPGFADATVVESSIQLRPTFPDNRPRIVAMGNKTIINGLFRHGFFAGPLGYRRSYQKTCTTA